MSISSSRILIVDSDPIVRSQLVQLLSRDYDVSIAENGQDALVRLEAGHRFDLILCDPAMPRMSGAALLQSLRRIDPGQADRVVLVTANPAEGTAASRHYHVAKPFRASVLKGLVDQVMSASRAGYFPRALGGAEEGPSSSTNTVGNSVVESSQMRPPCSSTASRQ